MITEVHASALVGLDATPVLVEVDLAPGLPGFHIVGLPDASVAESCDRVKCALRNSGFQAVNRRLVVNLAPGDLRKEGPRFDLAIALGVLTAGGQLDPEDTLGCMILGELALDGRLRPVRGVLSSAALARQLGLRALLVPQENAEEAALIEGVAVWPARDLNQALRLLRHAEEPAAVKPPARLTGQRDGPDLSGLVGQLVGRRAIEVAAAGGHHLLLAGPPGCGKTLLARCLSTILPPLLESEAVEVARVSSALGLPVGWSDLRPFQEPDCGVTAAGLLGSARPGEISRAHRGVLFLDEVGEFRRTCLEGMRTALETGRIEIVRANHRFCYPADFTLVAATNLCSCGVYGDDNQECLCTPLQRMRYLGKLSGPLRDRIDLQVVVRRMPASMMLEAKPQESSSSVRERVRRARELQRGRGLLNARLSGPRLRSVVKLDQESYRYLARALDALQLSGRAFEAILRVARTVADLRGCPMVEISDLCEAIAFRCLDRLPTAEGGSVTLLPIRRLKKP
jgi:magnesium chelatase family protein